MEAQTSSALFYCNTCKRLIEHMRYSCTVCKDFDVCENCMQMNTHNPKHGLEAILIPLPAPRTVPNDMDSLPSYNYQLRQTGAAESTFSPPTQPPSLATQEEEGVVIGPDGTRKRLKMSKQEADTLKAEMNQLLQELDEAHQRIGQLTSVLENKLSKQLIKGLLKPFNKQ